MAELPSHGNDRPPRAWLLRGAIFVLCASLFGCDHATKIAAHATLQGRPVPIYDGILELRYTPNPDTAFSLLTTLGLPKSPAMLLSVATLALAGVFVAWIAARKKASLAEHVGFAIVAAGALGNVVDRAARGFVIDFIHVTRWPVFNVADIAVVVGVAILAIASLRRGLRAPSTS